MWNFEIKKNAFENQTFRQLWQKYNPHTVCKTSPPFFCGVAIFPHRMTPVGAKKVKPKSKNLLEEVILNTVLCPVNLLSVHVVSGNQNIGLVRVQDEVHSEDHASGSLPHLRSQLVVLQEWRQWRGQSWLRPLLRGPGAWARRETFPGII